MHYEPPDVTWPPPEPDAGTVDGELSPLDEELLDELPELLVPPDVPELAEVPEPDVACPVLFAAELDDVWWVVPGRLNATAPAAIRLAAAADTVAARSRARPRSLSLAPSPARCAAEPRGELIW